MEHGLRIIPTGPDKYLLYCVAGDFVWSADESGEDCQLDLGLHEYRLHHRPDLALDIARRIGGTD
jgi:hypothetical protein